MLKEILNKPYSPHVSSGKFSISSVNGCWKKKYQQMKNLFKEEYDENTKRTFSLGDIYHRQIIGEIISKGENKGLHLVAAEFLLDHPFLSGRIDAVVSDGKDLFIVDCKSAGSYTMRKIEEGECPDNYQNQLQLYMFITGIHKGILLFIGKEKGKIIEYEVKYDQVLCEKLISEIKIFMEENIAKDIEPEEKCDGMPFGCPVCYPPKEIK
jgi:hypothetical protein